MRLQDIHERNKVMIAKRQSERNEKIAEYSRFQVVAKANALESKIGGLEAAVKSQTKVSVVAVMGGGRSQTTLRDTFQ